MLIDTHAHVHFDAYGSESGEVIQRALENGVQMVTVGTRFGTSKSAISCAEKYHGVWAVIGLHPNHTYQEGEDLYEGKFDQPEIKFDYEAYKKLASHSKVVGIGECGLDYYRLSENANTGTIKENQKAIFLQQIKLAQELNKALVIHCRPSPGSNDAYEDVLEILQEVRIKNQELRFEIHCFTGPLEIAQKIIALGGFLGLNGIITFDKTGTSEEVVKNIPLENIVLETDCPYLAPVPYRGKRNEPLYVKYVAEKIAEWKGLSLDQVGVQTTENAKQLFRFLLP